MCCGQTEHHGHRPMHDADECECGHAHHGHRSMHHADECGCGHGEQHGRGPMRDFGGCECGGEFPHRFGPVLWSKKKQIRMLEKLLEQKREEVQDLVDLLDELKQKQ